MSNPSHLSKTLRTLSQGEQVFQVVTPDESACVIEFTRHDSTFPPADAQEWLDDQNRNGRYLGHKVREHWKRNRKDRAMIEAADMIDRLAAELQAAMEAASQ